MNKFLVSILLAVLVLSFCSGCVVAPFQPPAGLAFTQYKAPLDVDYDNTALGPKTGSASSSSVLALVSFGDCSIQAAAMNGGIEKVNHADYEFFSILGLYTKTTVIVYGE